MGVTASHRRQRIGYVHELDGLRALAVLWVMFGHLHVPLFKNGGQLGVDAFFVLSGFLITNLLLEEFHERARINVRHFYVRRALRLWPALYVLLAVALVWSFVVLDPGNGHRLRTEIVYAATYSYDVAERAASHVNYMLYHTWSLALEEQFYVVWPPILMLFLRRRSIHTAIAVVSALVTVISVSRFAGHFGPLGLFDRRPDALLIGCVAALLFPPGESRPFDRQKEWIRAVPIIGVAAVIVVAGVVPRARFSPLYLRWVSPFYAIAIAALILVIVHTRPFWAKPLALRPFLEIGRRSYGLYLWHLPVFIAVGDSWIHRTSTVVQLAVKMILAFAVTWISYLGVERPALRLKSRFARPAVDDADIGHA